MKVTGNISIYISLILLLLLSVLGINAKAQDTLSVKKPKDKPKSEKESLKSKVKYSAKDSIVVNTDREQILLFGNADVIYENIEIKASFIQINFKSSEMFASGLKDSVGKLQGTPEFTEDKETFNADNITYNFKTRKGIIREISTKEGEGYLHGNKVKKMADNITFINAGSYTTCDQKEPHFDIRFLRAKVLPDNKIVSGPALMFIEGVPTPIGVPFGYFPINKGRKSGLIIPAYGESANRGFYLENGGYYWGINDYVDLSLKGDVYTRGSWALKANSDYNWLYHYSGNLNLSWSETRIGDEATPGFIDTHDFFIRWSHNQSDKARPNSRFSSNVNIGSSSYNKYNPTSTSDYLTNTFQSSISYSTVFAKNYNFSLNMRHSQNTQTKIIDLTLPEISLTANRFYPFQKKNRTGNPKWYESISINYLMNARNQISSPDSLLFKKDFLKSLNNGVMHTIPISGSFKLMKYFTLSSSVNYTERWYFRKTDIKIVNDSVITDTINGFNTERDFNVSTSLSTRLYGMFQFRKGPIRAIRHVITPSVGFYYTPYFNQYYKSYINPKTKIAEEHSIFENQIFGTAPSARSGSLNFNITNNLEMKVRSRKDTVTGLKKIILIENFNISESYDISKDSMNWSQLSMSGHTKLLKNIDLKYNSLWDPYVSNMKGRQNKFEWDVNHQLFSMKSTQWALALNWNLSSKKKKKDETSENSKSMTDKNKTKNKDEEIKNQNVIVNPNGDGYVDFNVPWNLNIYYTMMWTTAYSNTINDNKKTLVQTLAFNGDINLTKKWKIGFTSGYDFQNHDFSYTSVNIYRDLHCWEMVFNWIPTGFRKSYNFTIRVKASVLQDLKLMKKTDWRDTQY